MHPPCEMMVDSFLPAMREAVAKKLDSEGYSQGKIANLLGVTQASVSLYLKADGRAQRLLAELGVSEEDAALYASILAEDLKKSPVYAVNTLYSLWADALGRGVMCGAHRRSYPALEECGMCLRRFGGQTGSGADAIERVAAAVRMLEGSSSFVRVMPEVSVNIAYAPDGATSPSDVVAVPGRIVRVRGLPRSFMKPEFGASTHVATVLLSVIKRDGSKRAAMNLKLDPKVESTARSMRLRVLRLTAGSPMVEQLTRSLRGSSGPFDAIADPGGAGTEPGLYLFAGTPSEVAELGLKIARRYATPG